MTTAYAHIMHVDIGFMDATNLTQPHCLCGMTCGPYLRTCLDGTPGMALPHQLRGLNLDGTNRELHALQHVPGIVVYPIDYIMWPMAQIATSVNYRRFGFRLVKDDKCRCNHWLVDAHWLCCVALAG